MVQVELLAPARDYETAVDAIDCGADAVYIGAGKFGARYAATNSVEDIARTVEYAHRYGVKVYATLNTLLYDNELEEARAQAMALAEAGVDALIVQDMAYCRMGLPIPLHASTQTSCTSPEKVRFFEEVGFERAILERALSIEDIRAIRNATNIELEAFVHGAICVCDSGRCFLSRTTSERSGNRGECSQPCRLEYDLEDEQGRKIIEGKHLLSVRDMNLSMRLGEMIDAGVTSFKIEGRLKDRVYIRNIVSLYRRLLDVEIARREGVMRSSVGRSTTEFEPNAAKSFTRGASEYFFDGKVRGVASFDTPKAMGERIGAVVRYDRRGLMLDCDHDLATGDGVCFVSHGTLYGTNINGVEGRSVRLNNDEGIAVGVTLYRNYNRHFVSAVERSRIRRSVDITMRVEFLTEAVMLTATDIEGVTATCSVACDTQEVRDAVKGEAALRQQLSRTGDTIFDVRDVEIVNLRFVPMSVVGALRREVLGKLLEARIAHADNLPRRVFIEREATYPSVVLAPQDNVTNRIAREFYEAHGVERIAEGLDCRATMVGECVMQSSYCIRREIGECLLQRPKYRGKLYLVRGSKRYALRFDCKACKMMVFEE